MLNISVAPQPTAEKLRVQHPCTNGCKSYQNNFSLVRSNIRTTRQIICQTMDGNMTMEAICAILQLQRPEDDMLQF